MISNIIVLFVFAIHCINRNINDVEIPDIGTFILETEVPITSIMFNKNKDRYNNFKRKNDLMETDDFVEFLNRYGTIENADENSSIEVNSSITTNRNGVNKQNLELENPILRINNSKDFDDMEEAKENEYIKKKKPALFNNNSRGLYSRVDVTEDYNILDNKNKVNTNKFVSDENPMHMSNSDIYLNEQNINRSKSTILKTKKVTMS